jgi:hypothetical protein
VIPLDPSRWSGEPILVQVVWKPARSPLTAMASPASSIAQTRTGLARLHALGICDRKPRLASLATSAQQPNQHDTWLPGRARVEPIPRDSNQSLPTFEPVSVREMEFRREKVWRGQRLGRHFLATSADSGQQRPSCPPSPTAKPRKVKDYSDRAGKANLRRTAWWSWQDSNRRASDYEANLRSLVDL